jgi:hypothetical protein
MLGAQSYLNLQQVITSDALVVHLMIGIICITATLVLYESESRRNVQ